MRLKIVIPLVLTLILILVSPVMAETIEVLQGDTIYMNETCDISRVLGWSQQFAYWKMGYPVNDHPDIVIDTTQWGHMYKFPITAERGFVIGNWFKWDGKIEDAGNMKAFTIATGKRKVVNITPFVNESTIIIRGKEMPPQRIHILLAQGDKETLLYYFPENMSFANGQAAYLWLFGATPETTYSQGRPLSPNTILQQPLTYRANDSVYTYTFLPNLSETLELDQYTGFIQFVGNNSKADVFYDPVRNDLNSPYKDIPQKNLDGKVSPQILEDFVTMESNLQYTDDILVPVSLEVVRPSISLGDYWENQNYIMLIGSTPMAEGTEIKVILDPSYYSLPSDIKFHTISTFVQSAGIQAKDAGCTGAVMRLNNIGYNITTPTVTTKTPEPTPTPITTPYLAEEERNQNLKKAIGNPRPPYILGTEPPTPVPTESIAGKIRNLVKTESQCTEPPRVFKVGLPVIWDDLEIGQHTLYARLTTPSGETVSITKEFYLSGIWEAPTPTMTLRKIIMTKEGNLAEEPPILAVTPEETETVPEPTVSVNVTPPPAPISTTTPPPPTPTPVPTEPTADVNIDLDGLGVPTEPSIPVVAIVCGVIIFAVCKRRE